MSSATPFQLTSLQNQPALETQFYPQKLRIWPGFMLEDKVADRLWHYLSDVFSAFQLYLLHEDGSPVAVAQTIPLVWNGTVDDLPVGWGDGFQRGAADYDAGRTSNTLMALEVAIQPEYQGRGISRRMVEAVRGRAQEEGFQAVIVAVRPSHKSRYPLTPMVRYANWRRDDGAPFDPWLRVHWRCGGEILKIAHPSMVLEGTIAQWEEWTGMTFPESGEYVVPGALAPVEMDLAMDIGRYIEPNVWVHHALTTGRLRPG